uniref:Uncharacterized protein n=1 Tax=Leersia perrieri TaxID=77586 RepID=A0A0D9W567_9ORYZ
MDDFTFPTTASPELAAEPLRLHRRLLHFAASPLWFPSSAPPEFMDDREEEEGNSKMAETSELLRGGDGDGEEEKMDMLWEDFNEELQQQVVKRVGSCPMEAAAEGMEVCSPGESASDAESEPAVMRRGGGGGGGCAPALMMRATSRAGGTGHYRRTTSWVLLMKIFRRLFVIEKTISASGRHGRPPPPPRR